MALDDIVFSDGDGQNFILEIPVDTLHAPLDIVFIATLTDFVGERPIGTLNAPIDILMGTATANDVMVYPLVLSGGSGTGASAFAFAS